MIQEHAGKIIFNEFKAPPFVCFPPASLH